jgi:hypothetical protein
MARSRKKKGAASSVRRRRSVTKRRRDWTQLADHELLEVRLCDLGLEIRGTDLEDRVAALYAELDARDLRAKPHCWLSTEWFSPDGVPGFAIPFYLAHGRLGTLELRQMREIEGGTPRSCMQLMRHEAAHALDSAYGLHRRGDWRETFGAWTTPYPAHYQPRPYSKRYVRHLDRWYAQCHPAEDFAETFAVWLDPASRWRRKYKGWPALRKLAYVDGRMRELAGKSPRVRSREKVEPLGELTLTLGEYYEKKKERYGREVIHTYDRDLSRLFVPRTAAERAESAAEFLRRAQPRIRLLVSRSTGKPAYAIDRVLSSLIRRSVALDLVIARDRLASQRDATHRVALHAVKYIKNGYDQLPR